MRWYSRCTVCGDHPKIEKQPQSLGAGQVLVDKKVPVSMYYHPCYKWRLFGTCITGLDTLLRFVLQNLLLRLEQRAARTAFSNT